MIDRNKEITKSIDEKRHVAALFPKIRKIIQEYDGKCYDKRFPDRYYDEETAKKTVESYEKITGYFHGKPSQVMTNTGIEIYL